MLPYNYPLPNQTSDIVINIADLCKKHQVCTGEIYSALGGDYMLSVGRETKNYKFTGERDLIRSLQDLGFITLYDRDRNSSKIFFVCEKTFQWADYQKKNNVSKWYVRNIHSFKDFMLWFAFTVSLILGFIELLRSLKVIV